MLKISDRCKVTKKRICLAAPIIIQVKGKNALACLYFFKPITTHWCQTSNDAATLLLQNSVWGNAEVAMCILKTAHADNYRINVIDDSW